MENEIEITNSIAGLLLNLVSCNDFADGVNYADSSCSSGDKPIKLNTRFEQNKILFIQIKISSLTMALLPMRLGN